MSTHDEKMQYLNDLMDGKYPNCPVCNAPVRECHSDEGTSYYLVDYRRLEGQRIADLEAELAKLRRALAI